MIEKRTVGCEIGLSLRRGKTHVNVISIRRIRTILSLCYAIRIGLYGYKNMMTIFFYQIEQHSAIHFKVNDLSAHSSEMIIKLAIVWELILKWNSKTHWKWTEALSINPILWAVILFGWMRSEILLIFNLSPIKYIYVNSMQIGTFRHHRKCSFRIDIFLQYQIELYSQGFIECLRNCWTMLEIPHWISCSRNLLTLWTCNKFHEWNKW